MSDVTVTPQVLDEIDGGHPTTSKFSLDGVAVGECSLEVVRLIGRGRGDLAPSAARQARNQMRNRRVSLIDRQP